MSTFQQPDGITSYLITQTMLLWCHTARPSNLQTTQPPHTKLYFFFLPPPFFLRALSALRTLKDLQNAWMVVAAFTISAISLSAASRFSLATRRSSMICWYSASSVLNRSSNSWSCFFSSVYTRSISSYSLCQTEFFKFNN